MARQHTADKTPSVEDRLFRARQVLSLLSAVTDYQISVGPDASVEMAWEGAALLRDLATEAAQGLEAALEAIDRKNADAAAPDVTEAA